MNPFEMRPGKKAELIVNWEKLWAAPYNKNEVEIKFPYLIQQNETQITA